MVVWNTGSAAERFRSKARRDAAQYNLKLKTKKKIKPQATSGKPQAYKNFFWPTIPTRRQASSNKKVK